MKQQNGEVKLTVTKLDEQYHGTKTGRIVFHAETADTTHRNLLSVLGRGDSVLDSIEDFMRRAKGDGFTVAFDQISYELKDQTTAQTWKEPQQAYKAGNRAWLPCTQELYDDALGAVPPLYIGQWWANSEPWTHAAGEPVYLCFRSSPRLACRMATPEELRAEQAAAKGTP